MAFCAVGPAYCPGCRPRSARALVVRELRPIGPGHLRPLPRCAARLPAGRARRLAAAVRARRARCRASPRHPRDQVPKSRGGRRGARRTARRATYRGRRVLHRRRRPGSASSVAPARTRLQPIGTHRARYPDESVAHARLGSRRRAGAECRRSRPSDAAADRARIRAAAEKRRRSFCSWASCRVGSPKARGPRRRRRHHQRHDGCVREGAADMRRGGRHGRRSRASSLDRERLL